MMGEGKSSRNSDVMLRVRRFFGTIRLCSLNWGVGKDDWAFDILTTGDLEMVMVGAC
jgi:hypothetical protein